MARHLYWRFAGFYFFYFAFFGAFTPFFSLYLKALSFTAAQIGILMSLPQMMRVFSPNLWGWLADRTGRRTWFVRLACAATLVSLTGVFVKHTFVWLFIVLTLVGFFWTASLPLVEAMTLAYLKGDSGRYGRVRLWGSLGFILIVMGAGVLLGRLPVSVIPWLLIGMGSGIACCAQILPDSTAPAERHAGHTRRLPRSALVAFFVACGLMSLAHGAYYSFYSLLLASKGYGGTVIGAMWTIGVVCEIVLFLRLRTILSRIRVGQLLTISFLLGALRFVLIGQFANTLAVIVVAQTLHAASFAAFHACAMAVVHHCYGEGRAARGQALYNSLSYGLGGAVGSMLSGWSWDVLGPAATFTAAGAMAALGLLILLRYAGSLLRMPQL